MFQNHRDKIWGNNVTVVYFIKSGQANYSATKPALSLNTEIPTF